MAPPAIAHVPTLSNVSELTAWLNSLWEINVPPSHRENTTIPQCACCGWQQLSTEEAGYEAWDPDNGMLILPCDCVCRDVCLRRLIRQHDNCPGCGTLLFRRGYEIKEEEEWSLEHFLAGLALINPFELADADRSCSICRVNYGSASKAERFDGAQRANRIQASKKDLDIDYPVGLPCGHIFGLQCLRIWLSSAADRGGNGNSCPCCRRVLFEPWPLSYEGDFDILPYDLDDEPFDVTEDYVQLQAEEEEWEEGWGRDV